MLNEKAPTKNVTEARLVAAAAQLFARRGFKATTTRDIATLAGLNEATLFRYFTHKTNLFVAALESHLNRITIGRDLRLSLASDDDPEVVLPKIVGFVLTTLAEQPELQHLLYVAGFEVTETLEIIRERLGPIFDLLCGYFHRVSAKGALRDIDPAMAIAGLWGAVAAHREFRRFFTNEKVPDLSTEPVTEAFCNLCLHGLMPLPDSRQPSADPLSK
jgi:AcrR family transcriptional regulator